MSTNSWEETKRRIKKEAHVFRLEVLLVIPVQGAVTQDLAVREHQLHFILSDDGRPLKRVKS